MTRKSLSDVLMKQHEKRSAINAVNAVNRRGAVKGAKHHNAKYTEEQIKDAKAIKIAFEQLGMRANIVAIAALTGINIMSVRGLFRSVRPTWTHLQAEQWRVDKFKKEIDLHSMEKARMARAKRMEWYNHRIPDSVKLKIVPNRTTAHPSVNDFFTYVCQLIGREPESFEEFIAVCEAEVKAGRLDADYYYRNRRLQIKYRLELYPNSQPPLTTSK